MATVITFCNTKLVLLVCLLLLVGAALGQSVPAPYETAARFFDYDAKAPLDFQDKGAEHVSGAQVHDVSYASPKGGRVPAFLVVPAGKGPFPAVIFVHWGQGDRTEFLAESLILARAGAISLLLEGVFNRSNATGDLFLQSEKERESYIQLVTDIRRGVDLLLARSDVDPKRVAYVGHSYGATWGGALAGVEKRIKCYVLMGGLPTLADFSQGTWYDDFVHKTYTREQVTKYQQVMSEVAPEILVGHAAPATVMFQWAQHDRYITPKSAKEYFQAASQPKLQMWYYSSHEFNDPAALMDRDQFLQQQLRLRPVVPIILQRMGMKATPAPVVRR